MRIFDPINYVLLVACGCTFLYIAIEALRYFRHLKNLQSIPVRIHINGSRGKSSVTRLVGAVLRSCGKTTITKTTGTAPRFILADGSEIPIFRPGKPNIIEQLKVVAAAKRHGAHFLVTECMAVTPEYITMLEDRIIQSSVGVMTNIREDHLDVMGPTMYDVAINMSKSLPRNGIVFTAEKKWLAVLQQQIKKRGSRLVAVSEDDISDTDMEGFPYIEHKENVAIALAIGKHFGIAKADALKAMYSAQPDPGVLRETIIKGKNGSCYFFNALAANDPDSSQIIWDMALSRRTGLKVIVLILRFDRQQRTESFARVLGHTMNADRYIIAGSPVSAIVDVLRKRGIPENYIMGFEEPTGKQVADALMSLVVNTDVVACAMGNIIGLGKSFLNELHGACYGG